MKTVITTTTITDDLGGPGEASTVRFSYQGREYEIDLNSRNAETLQRRQDALYGPYIEKARDVTSDAANERRLIRAWAARQGIEIGTRGRIPQDVIDQYDEAQMLS